MGVQIVGGSWRSTVGPGGWKSVGVQIVGAQGAQGAAVQEIKAAGEWKSSTSADL